MKTPDITFETVASFSRIAVASDAQIEVSISPYFSKAGKSAIVWLHWNRMDEIDKPINEDIIQMIKSNCFAFEFELQNLESLAVAILSFCDRFEKQEGRINEKR